VTTVDSMLHALDTPSPRSDLTWTTGNVAEAFPGVFTTLGLSFVFAPMEMAFRRMFYDLGIYSSTDLVVPNDVEDCFWTVFDGWGAGNIDKFRDIANRMPGTTASAVEQQLFGYVRPETIDANTMTRYPFIFAKAPRWLWRSPKLHDAMFAELRAWRQRQLAIIDGLDESDCHALLHDARSRFEDVMSIHMGVAMASSSLAEKVADIARAEGHAGLEAALLSGVGSDENEVAYDLWALAHERITQREFMDRHGYHGPNEGQLSGVTWREDPAPILARMADYRAISVTSPRAPRARSAKQTALRAQALDRLLAEMPAPKRAAVRTLVKVAARYLALREQGKAGYLIAFDVARAASRRIGRLLTEQGVFENPEDVFHVRYDVLIGGLHGSHRELVAERAAQYRRRQSLRLPKSWTGLPQLVSPADGGGARLGAGESISGVAASGGVVEGRTRIVQDPDEIELDDGDILVCETTDPAWVPLFLVAGAVVTDHGGLLSHGPIVARELGIPCVCGTEDGTQRIGEGQLVRVDGNRGTVTILEDRPSVVNS
jgi:phosphohistidine swiveling domain-containing protein